jgi:hypothetical protein
MALIQDPMKFKLGVHITGESLTIISQVWTDVQGTDLN